MRPMTTNKALEMADACNCLSCSGHQDDEPDCPKKVLARALREARAELDKCDKARIKNEVVAYAALDKLKRAEAVAEAAKELHESMSVGQWENEPRMDYDEVQIDKPALATFKAAVRVWGAR